MIQWILEANGEVISGSTLRPLQVDELHCAIEVKKRDTFDALIERKHGGSNKHSNALPSPKDDGGTLLEPWSVYQDDNELLRLIPDINDAVYFTGRLIYQQQAYTIIINAEVKVQQGDKIQSARVLKRSIGPDGKVTGCYDDTPTMNSMVYAT